MSRAARNSAKHRTFTMIFFLIPTLLFLAWWQRTGTGKFSKQLDGFKVPRQVANRLFIGLRHQWRRIFACYFVVFLEKIRVLEALAQSFFDGLYPLPGHGWGKNEWCAGQTEIAKTWSISCVPARFWRSRQFRANSKSADVWLRAESHRGHGNQSVPSPTSPLYERRTLRRWPPSHRFRRARKLRLAPVLKNQ